MGPSPRRGSLDFVIQKHRARALHYDFRLEIGGVLASWSVPKGPTLQAGVRRLAMPTEDHPREYGRFEGVLPRSSGSGVVMLWDLGGYNPEVETSKGVRTEVVANADAVAESELKAGMLKFTLYGSKLRGSFALVRTGGIGGRDAWLLIKHKDMFCAPAYEAGDYDFSALTGRSMAQISAEGGGAPSTTLS